MGVFDYAKALLAGLTAAISNAIPVVDNGLTASEWLGIILAFLVGTGLVAAVPNRNFVRKGSVTGETGNGAPHVA